MSWYAKWPSVPHLWQTFVASPSSGAFLLFGISVFYSDGQSCSNHHPAISDGLNCIDFDTVHENLTSTISCMTTSFSIPFPILIFMNNVLCTSHNYVEPVGCVWWFFSNNLLFFFSIRGRCYNLLRQNHNRLDWFTIFRVTQ